ncbi:hypothetical protein ACMFMF_001710 [Clarireedia jacksonii]
MSAGFRKDLSMDSETDYTASKSPSYSPSLSTRSPTPENPYPQPPPPPTPAKAKIIFKKRMNNATTKWESRKENRKRYQAMRRSDGLSPPSTKQNLKSSEPQGGICPFPAAKDEHLSTPEPAALPEIFPSKLTIDTKAESSGDHKQASMNTYKSPYQKSTIRPRRRLRNLQPPPIIGRLTRSIVHRKKLSDEVIYAHITFTDDPTKDSYENFLARVFESAGMTNNKKMVLGMLVVNWDNGISLQDAGIKVGGADKQRLATRIASEQDWRDAVRTMRQQRWANQGWTAWWWENKGAQPVGLYF